MAAFNKAKFRFYEELNDFLPVGYRKKKFPFHFTGTPSVKNTIEAIGVPHPEIDLILINPHLSWIFEQLRNILMNIYQLLDKFMLLT